MFARPLVAAGIAMSGAAQAGQESPQAVLDRFAANFHTMDAAAQAALFRPDATFLGSSVPGMLRGPEGALGYFRTAWANAAPGTMTCEPVFQQPAPDVVLFSAICRLVRPERTAVLRANGTVMRDAEGWRFADLHVSATPPPRR
jgi:ketosteroid isomerase-like protein